MNVIIPIGGLGTRFLNEGYRFPKPMVNVLGQPILLHLIRSLNFNSKDTLWLILRKDMEEQFHIYEKVKKLVSVPVRSVLLSYTTQGAAETLLCGIHSMSEEERKKRVLSLDCDTLYYGDVIGKARELGEGEHGTFVFTEEARSGIFSYVKVGLDGRKVVEMKEKQAISNLANTGAYTFSSGSALYSKLTQLLSFPLSSNSFPLIGKEFYTSGIFTLLLKEGATIRALHLNENSFHSLGTPEQVNDFLVKNIKGEVVLPYKQRFCFDLDSTLLTLPRVEGDYTTCQGIYKNIYMVRLLYDLGHTIIIYTARRMKTHEGNVGAAMRDIGRITFDTLEEFQIPYHEIYFGKPYADVYIDDKSVNALMDTSKEIGCFDFSQYGKKEFDAPRSFNTLQKITGGVIRKSSSLPLDGEIFFYNNIPNSLSSLFPTLLSFTHTGEENFYDMNFVSGVSFSAMLCHGTLTKGRFQNFLSSLLKIHSYSSSSSPLPSFFYKVEEGGRSEVKKGKGGKGENIYKNYADNLEKRYRELDQRKTSFYKEVLSFLREYEIEDRGVYTPIIHGDPVFSNAILTPEQKVVFLDMRGKQGDVCTLEGDVLYDLGKVYQSLTPYFFILEGIAMSPQTEKMLDELKIQFFNFIEENYNVDNVQKISSALILSMAPLHSIINREIFITLAQSVWNESF